MKKKDMRRENDRRTFKDYLFVDNKIRIWKNAANKFYILHVLFEQLKIISLFFVPSVKKRKEKALARENISNASLLLRNAANATNIRTWKHEEGVCAFGARRREAKTREQFFILRGVVVMIARSFVRT